MVTATAGFQRDTGHNPEALWESTAKPLFDRVMQDFARFDNISLMDLVGDNSILLMSTFANRLANSPPISPHTNKPYSSSTLKAVLQKVVYKLKQKFANATNNLPELFPDDELAKWKKRIQDGRNRTLMEGEDESDVFKNTFPIPREHSARTILFPSQDFPDLLRRQASRRVDLLSIGRYLFQRERFTDLAKLLITFKAIGRGGEVKFLSYRRMMFDETYNMLFTQWFQRKNLKSSPSGFAPDFIYPETCVFFALGCFWACDSGLVRPNGVGEPGTAQARLSSYVFQDLHDMQDASVASQLSNIIRGIVPPQLKNFYSVKSLRIGAMTLLAWDPAVTYEESVALGGWSTASNSDWYTWTYLVAIIPAALSLSGYPDPRVLAYLPSCGRLFMEGNPSDRFTPDKFGAFVKELFPNSMREFQPPHG